MEIKVVLGLNFGDEGKGITVQNLCKQAIAEGKKPLVIRFSGGPQAAHTIINEDTVHICSSFGSGALLEVPTLYEDGCIDPISLFNEARVLNNNSKIKIKLGTKIITPYDVLFSQNDPITLSDGTCGKGVYATIKRYQDTSFEIIGLRTISGLMSYLEAVHHYYKIKGFDFNISDNLKRRFCECTLKLDTTNDVNYFKKNFDVLIYEGTQGLLLDPITSPFKPHVTSTKLLPEKNWFAWDDVEWYFVTRSYLTRHGNGFEPIQCDDFYDLSNKFESNKYNKFQGEFKTGILSIDLINRIIDRNLLDQINNKKNLVITHMDIPVEQNKFIFEQQGKIVTFEDLNLEVCPEEICKYLSDNLFINFDNVYYTTSPNSSLHVSHMSRHSRS